MDIQSYIETGKLEAYALGICSADEAHEVESLCHEHPELKAELEVIRAAMNTYAHSHARKVPAHLKQQVMHQLERLESNTAAAPAKKEIPVFQLYSRLRKVAVAAIALCVLSLGFNVILYQRWKNMHEEVVALNAEKLRLAEEMQVNKVKFDQMHTDMAIMSDPHTMKVMMKGVEKSPASMAMVYWNKNSKEVFLAIKELPMPRSGMQYQLWAIVDGKPVDAGMISMVEGDTSLHPMKNFDTAQAFAITLEKQGGSPAPTLSELYVMGNVSL